MRSKHGSTLLECAASLALSAILLGASTQAAQAAATILQRSRVQADTIDVARNLLEHALGAPCAAPPDCPAGYRCELVRSPLTAAADRVVARAIREDGRADERFHTLAPAPACGG